MLIIRPVCTEDLDDIARLARLAGEGMTSLPQDRSALRSNIELAVRSFANSTPDPTDYFLLVMEDTETREVVGTAAVYARTGARQAFYAYRLMSVTHYSHSLSLETRSTLLHLTNDYTDYSEMGTLFLDPRYRGNGHWLSRSRYLLLGLFPERFAEHVIAELRGWLDESGESPFWQAIGAKFFEMTYAEADRLCGVGSNQFITELMPKYPIYTNLLPKTAADVIGKPHESTLRAMELLLAEGFEYENLVDIFDGGPLVRARVEKLKSVEHMRCLPCRIVDLRENGNTGLDKSAIPTLIANTELPRLNIQYAPALVGKKNVQISNETAAALGVTQGDTIALVAGSGDQ